MKLKFNDLIMLNTLIIITTTVTTIKTQAKETHRFFCNSISVDDTTNNQPKEFDQAMISRFDTMAKYFKKSNASYNLDIAQARGNKSGTNFQDNTVSTAYLFEKKEQQGFYREIFDVYRLNINNNELIHSYVYYIDKTDWKQNLKRQIAPLPDGLDITNQPILFDTINIESPKENYMKIGWDKSKYVCYKLSYLKFLRINIKLFFAQVGL